MANEDEQNPPPLPEAEPELLEPPARFNWVLGPPFAKTGSCEPLDAGAGVAGCFLTMQCDCGQRFRINLLQWDPKHCPGCKALFTHAFVVYRVEDDGAVDDIFDHLSEVNEPSSDAGDEDEDDGGDEDIGEAEDEDEPDE